MKKYQSFFFFFFFFFLLFALPFGVTGMLSSEIFALLGHILYYLENCNLDVYSATTNSADDT